MVRSRQLSRILRVQDQLRKVAEARLRSLEARHVELEATEASIFASLSSDDPRDMGLAHLAGDRLRWVDRDLKENELVRREATAQWRALAQRALATGRLQARASLEERRVGERKELEEILACVGSASTSLP